MKIIQVIAISAAIIGSLWAAEDPSAYMISTPALVKEGQEKFKQMCSACHGESGDGNTPVAASLKPPPRNLADPKVEWKFGHEPINVYKTLMMGSKGTGMVGFAAAIPSEKERWALVHFINSLAGSKGKFTPITAKNLSENVEAAKKIQAEAQPKK